MLRHAGLENQKEGSMNLYEVMFILDPDMGEEEREKVLARFKSAISKNKGDLIRIDDQGLKSLAYKINKKSRGHYHLAYLEGPGAMVAEIERLLRIDENVMRFVVVRQEEHVTRADLERTASVEEKAEEKTPGGEEIPEQAETGADNAG